MSLPGSFGEEEKLGMISLALQIREKGWTPGANETVNVEYQVSLAFA